MGGFEFENTFEGDEAFDVEKIFETNKGKISALDATFTDLGDEKNKLLEWVGTEFATGKLTPEQVAAIKGILDAGQEKGSERSGSEDEKHGSQDFFDNLKVPKDFEDMGEEFPSDISTLSVEEQVSQVYDFSKLTNLGAFYKKENNDLLTKVMSDHGPKIWGALSLDAQKSVVSTIDSSLNMFEENNPKEISYDKDGKEIQSSGEFVMGLLNGTTHSSDPSLWFSIKADTLANTKNPEYNDAIIGLHLLSSLPSFSSITKE